MSDYWADGITDAFEEAGIVATPEQIELVIGAVEGGHENYGLAHGHECIPNPLLGEVQRLQRELDAERDKVHCEECNGHGRIITQGPSHGSNSQCWKCHGKGKHSP